MDREIQLIRRVVGDPSFAEVKHRPEYDSDYFIFYNVNLTSPKYRGFPPRWDFAILRAGKAQDQSAIINDSFKLIKKIPDTTPPPLVLISDSLEVHLEDNIFFAGRNIFCLDASDLPSQHGKKQPYVEPLRRAIRRRLDRSQVAKFFHLVPYQNGDPATGWRFYGRKQELDKLLDSSQSYVIVGGRRIGKTSLMLEANARLQDRGEATYYVSVEECRSASEVIKKLLQKIDARDSAAAVRRSQALDERLLTTILKRLTSRNKITLFLDELGNVLIRMAPEDWSFFGVLRQFSQQGRLRFVISCFQEYFLRQQEGFNGPLINFARTMRLGSFSPPETEDLLLTPLEFWRPLGEDRTTVKEAVLAKVGRHPRFLQAFCYSLFEKVARESRVLPAMQSLLGTQLVECFKESIDQVFWIQNSATLNYLFLKRCAEADNSGQKLTHIEITDEWMGSALRDLGYEAPTLERRNLLEGMELRGFTSRADGNNGDRQIVVAPIVYFYFKNTGDLQRLLARLAEDIRIEGPIWGLQPISKGVAHAQ